MLKDLNKLKKNVKKDKEAKEVKLIEKLRKSRGIYINLKLVINRTLSSLSIKSGLYYLIEFYSL
jgi:hypothetical protein